MSISQLSAQQRLRATAATAALRSNSVGAPTTRTGIVRQPDAVTISASGRSMATAQKAVSTAPELREDRINALKSAIAAGTYSVNSQTLARSITGSLGR
jgi:negative regulator of flagellin synthesis FlgM